MRDHVLLNKSPLLTQFANSLAKGLKETPVIIHAFLCKRSTSRNTTSRLACLCGSGSVADLRLFENLPERKSGRGDAEIVIRDAVENLKGLPSAAA